MVHVTPPLYIEELGDQNKSILNSNIYVITKKIFLKLFYVKWINYYVNVTIYSFISYKFKGGF